MARTYFEAHPPARQQFYTSRANPPTGGVAVHTSEGVMDAVAPDTGAENLAAFIVRRTDGPGSYSMLVDSDSTVQMAPDHWTTFHTAASGHNSRTWGIAFACRTTDLHPDSEWTSKAFRNAAREIVAYWRRGGWNPIASARWLGPGQTLSGPGLFHHGTAQPWDRTDAFVKNPHRDRLEKMLVDYILQEAHGTLPEEDEVKARDLLLEVDGGVYLTTIFENSDGTITGSHVGVHVHGKTLDTLRFIGVPIRKAQDFEADSLGVLPDARSATPEPHPWADR